METSSGDAEHNLADFFKITMIPHHFLTLAHHLSACQIMFGAVLAVSAPVGVDGC
jgi:hypothetical protein